MFPASTEFNKRIPKTKFYEHLDISRSVKDSFVKDIDYIIWSNKIAPTTVNISVGKTVEEIQVFRIALKGQELNNSVLRIIDEQIPYHILFILERGEKRLAWINYKEKAKSGDKSFRFVSSYRSEWVTEDKLDLEIEGITLDEVYTNFIKQLVTVDDKNNWDDSKSLKENSAEIDRIIKIKKQIKSLEKKVKNEKQFNKKIKLNEELKKLKRELEEQK